MKGHILSYSIETNSGIISGGDDRRYNFGGADWMDDQPPRPGMEVDFNPVGDQAADIYAVVGTGPTYAYGGAPGQRSKSKVAAGVLAIVVGLLGIHKFYLGYTGPGIILLLCGTIGWLFFAIPPIIASIVCLIEGIIYLTKSDDEFERQYVVNRKSWF